MKKEHFFSFIISFLFLTAGLFGAEEKELPAIHFSEDSSPSATSEEEAPNAGETPHHQETVYIQPVETAAFNGITPSQTTVKELHEMLGEPSNVRKDGAGEGIDIEEFEIEGFKAVDFHIIKGVVYGVIAELPESVDARKLAADLQMDHIQSVFLTNEKGVIQGEIFPEIGVAFAYDPSKPLGTMKEMQKNPQSVPMNTLQIWFQPVGPEPFLLRAETWADVNPKKAYKDVLQALKLDPTNKKGLGYKKIMEENLPELKAIAEEKEELEAKTENTPEPQNTPEPETPEPEKKTEPAEEKAEEPQNNSDLNTLNPPDLDFIEDETISEEAETNVKPKEGVRKLEESPEISTESSDQPVVSEVKTEADSEVKNSTEPAEEKIPTPTAQELPDEEETSLPNETGSLRPMLDGEESNGTGLELPTELSEDLDLLKEPSGTGTGSKEPELPVLSFEDELFEKVESLARRGRFESAQELLEEIRKRFLENPFISFRCNLVEGDILMILPIPNPEGAFGCHRMAAEQGEKLLNGKVFKGRKYPLTDEERQKIQLLLLDVWLGAASDIALGPWEQKEVDCRKWLLKTSTLLNEIAPAESADFTREKAELRYKITYRALSIALQLGQNFQPNDYVNQHLDASMKFLEKAQSATEYFEICTRTALLMDDVSTIYVLQKNPQLAKQCLDRGIRFMEQVKANRKKFVTNEIFLLAQLYYHRGQLLVMTASPNLNGEEKTKIHENAVTWYEKSIPCLMGVIKTRQWKDLLQLGKIMNGMSVSYAKVGNTQKALILLKTGVFCLEKHTASNPKDVTQLRIPYQNLIRMLNYLDKTEDAVAIQKKLNGLNIN